MIKSKMNGKVVDVDQGNAQPGASLIMWPMHRPPRDNQLFYFDSFGAIRSKMNDFAFDSSGKTFQIECLVHATQYKRSLVYICSLVLKKCKVEAKIYL